MTIHEVEANVAGGQGNECTPLSASEARERQYQMPKANVDMPPPPTPLDSLSILTSSSEVTNQHNIRPVCRSEGCTQSFGRIFERTRHEREVHGAQILCLFEECSWKGSKRKRRYNEHMFKVHNVVSKVDLRVPPSFSEYAASTPPNHSGRISELINGGSNDWDYSMITSSAYIPVEVSPSDSGTSITVPSDAGTLSTVLSEASTSITAPSEVGTLDAGTSLLSLQRSLMRVKISSLLVDKVLMSKVALISSERLDSKPKSPLPLNDSTSSGSVSPFVKTDNEEDGGSNDNSSEHSLSDEYSSINGQAQSGSSTASKKFTFAKREMVRRLMDQFFIIFDQVTNGETSQSHTPASNQNSSSIKTSSHASYCNRQTLKRQRQTDQTQDSEDGEDGEYPQIRVTLDPSKYTKGAVQLACPYRKNNPQKYNLNEWKSCALLCKESVARVKSHLYQKHLIHQCSRCKCLFKNEEELQAHLVAAQRCQMSSKNISDGISTTVQEQLRSRKRLRHNQSEEDRWRAMYQVLFIGEEIPSPYFEPVLDGFARPSPLEVPRSEDYIRLELPRIFQETLERAINCQTLPIERHIQSQLNSMIQQCYETALANYHMSFNPSLSIQDSPITVGDPSGASALPFENSMQTLVLPSNDHLWSSSTNVDPNWYALPIATESDTAFPSFPNMGYNTQNFVNPFANRGGETVQSYSAVPPVMHQPRLPMPIPPPYLPAASINHIENSYSQYSQFPQYQNFGGNNNGVNAIPPLDWNPLPHLAPVAADPSTWTGLAGPDNLEAYDFDLYPQYNPNFNTHS